MSCRHVTLTQSSLREQQMKNTYYVPFPLLHPDVEKEVKQY